MPIPNSSTLTAKPTLENLKKNISRELPGASTLIARPDWETGTSSRQRSRTSSNVSDITEPRYEPAPLSPVAKRLRDRSMARSQLSEPLSPNSQTRQTEPIKFDTWTKPELVAYAKEHNIKGPRGGDPENMKPSTLLKLVKSKGPYTGYGIDPLKTKFEIVDGEIQSGNNNPQLMRDAKKLLKEMVQQKMITLYEAQSHMKHLRKMNKI